MLDLQDANKRPAAALWLLWLAAGVSVFSASRLGSPQYLESFSPALVVASALCGLALVREDAMRRKLAAIGLIAAGIYSLIRYDDYGNVGSLIVVAGGLAAASGAAVFISTWFKPASLETKLRRTAMFGFASLVVVPLLVSYASIRKAPVEGLLPGTVFMTLDSERSLRYNPNGILYLWLTGNVDFLARPLNFLRQASKSQQELIATPSATFASPMVAQYGLAAVPVFNEFRQVVALDTGRLNQLIDSGKLKYALVSPFLMNTEYPQAVEFFASRCRNVSNQTGASVLYGFILYECEPAGGS
jgi:hypothetical protein